MAENFDPYLQWLDIPTDERPPDHYQLLGLKRFEDDRDVVEAAAEQQIGLLFAFRTGEHAALCQQLLDEVNAAKECLLNENRKTGYDRGLRRRLQLESPKLEPPQPDTPAPKAPPTSPTEQPASPSANQERLTAGPLLDIIEARKLLPVDLMRKLRKQVDLAEKTPSAAAVAKALVAQGHLTAPLAKRLLADAPNAVRANDKRPPADELPGLVPIDSPNDEPLGLVPIDKPDDEPLGLAPIDGSNEEPLGLVPIDEPADEEMGLVPLPEKSSETSSPPAKKSNGDAATKKKKSKSKTPSGKSSTGASSTPSGSSLNDELISSTTGLGGPLDGLMDDQAQWNAAADPLMPAPRKRGLSGLFSRSKKPKKTDHWDSSLMMVGGGALLVTVILGGFLVWSLTRQTGDEALRLASQAYHDGSYTDAIHKYTKYLEKFPGHKGESIARVHRGLAQLRQATSGTHDWSASLDTAKNVLKQIESEPEFQQAHADLSAMLLDIAEGLATDARKAQDTALVAKSRESLALLEKHVPRSLWRATKMDEVRTSLAQTEHSIAQDDELRNALAAIAQATTKGNANEAYRIRRQLLSQYPTVANDQQLSAAIAKTSQTQQAAVHWVDEARAASTTDTPTTVLSTTIVAQRFTHQTVPQVEGHIVFAKAKGACYSLDAASGKVLWSRYQGLDSNTVGAGFPPQAFTSEAGGDVLLVASETNELQRIEGTTGRLLWRQTIGERFTARPVIAEGRIYVAAPSGKLVVLDAASGATIGYVQFPQPLRVAPAVDVNHRLIFQLADQFNLFVLRLDGVAETTRDQTMPCITVVHVGHELGSITAPPVVARDVLLVAVNDLASDCTLQFFTIEEGHGGEEGQGGTATLTPVYRTRLQGRVDEAAAVDDRYLAVATDLGSLAVFQAGSAETNPPLKTVASRKIGGEPHLIRFPFLSESRVWLADNGVTAFDIQASTSRLVPKWTTHQSSPVTQPLVQLGTALYYVRHDPKTTGLVVSAIRMDDSTEFWETYLAVPLPSEPRVADDGTTVTVVNAIGGLFPLNAADVVAGQVVDTPLVAIDPAQLPGPVRCVVDLGSGVVALSVGEASRQVAVYDPQQRPIRFRWLLLPDDLACCPIAFQSGLLAPSKPGSVFLVDPNTSAMQCDPFQPRLNGDSTVLWRRPTATSDAALLADGRGAIYRVAIEPKPRPHLAVSAQATTQTPLVSPLVSFADAVAIVDAENVIQVFSADELKPVGRQSLDSACVWGPVSLGQSALLATEQGTLVCLDPQGGLRWKQTLSTGPLVGTPWLEGESFLVAATDGTIVRHSLATGQVYNRSTVGRPLGTGPVKLGERLLVGGHDGTLYVISQPD